MNPTTKKFKQNFYNNREIKKDAYATYISKKIKKEKNIWVKKDLINDILDYTDEMLDSLLHLNDRDLDSDIVEEMINELC